MISITSATNTYIVQPVLLEKHRQTLNALSLIAFMRRELAFFQKLLEKYSAVVIDAEQKQKISHFQNLILYYNGELLNTFGTRLRLHEKKLAEMLETVDETNTEYFREHDGLMNEVHALNEQFLAYKEEFYSFIEKLM